jgi:hypothetical protein
MSRAFAALIVCGIVVAVSGLGSVVAGAMVGSMPMAVAGVVSAIGGLGMATFGFIGRKQRPPSS